MDKKAMRRIIDAMSRQESLHAWSSLLSQALDDDDVTVETKRDKKPMSRVKVTANQSLLEFAVYATPQQFESMIENRQSQWIDVECADGSMAILDKKKIDTMLITPIEEC